MKSEDPRLLDFIQKGSIQEKTSARVGLIGYADDEGIELNGGRPGAALGPEAFRKAFFKMTPSLDTSTPSSPLILDCGDIQKQKGNLAQKHEQAFQNQKQALEKGLYPLSVGGGHDYGFSDFDAFCEFNLSQNRTPVVINFDAHLDVRPNTKGNHSGTPFFRLLEKYKNKIQFFEFGLQDWCNSKNHFEWAQAQGAKLFTLDHCTQSGLSLSSFVLKQLQNYLDQKHSLALSMDMDCLSSSYAPGASQVFPVGFEVPEFVRMWRALCALSQTKQVGIYELSPPFDHDSQSAKMAAILAHVFTFEVFKRNV